MQGPAAGAARPGHRPGVTLHDGDRSTGLCWLYLLPSPRFCASTAFCFVLACCEPAVLCLCCCCWAYRQHDRSQLRSEKEGTVKESSEAAYADVAEWRVSGCAADDVAGADAGVSRGERWRMSSQMCK